MMHHIFRSSYIHLPGKVQSFVVAPTPMTCDTLVPSGLVSLVLLNGMFVCACKLAQDFKVCNITQCN
jgi:hypothetical protein